MRPLDICSAGALAGRLRELLNAFSDPKPSKRRTAALDDTTGREASSVCRACITWSRCALTTTSPRASDTGHRPRSRTTPTASGTAGDARRDFRRGDAGFDTTASVGCPMLSETKAWTRGALRPAVARAIHGRTWALVERVEIGPAAPTAGSGRRDWPAWCAASAQVRLTRRDWPRERGGQHYGPDAAGHPAAAGAEDGGSAGAGLRRGDPPHARRPNAREALARAFRYQRLLDEGRYASISEMAVAERIERGYLGSLLRLTLLAPDIVEAILDGRQPDLALPALLKPFPDDWERQRDRGSAPSRSDDPAARDRPRRRTGRERAAGAVAAELPPALIE